MSDEGNRGGRATPLTAWPPPTGGVGRVFRPAVSAGSSDPADVRRPQARYPPTKFDNRVFTTLLKIDPKV